MNSPVARLLPSTRLTVSGLGIALLLPGVLSAQITRTACVRNTALSGVAGGAIGAWLGFFTAKVKVSDWDDAARGPAAHRMKNRYTIAGAALGLAAGTLLHARSACGAPAAGQIPATTSPRVAHQPITLEEITRSAGSGSVYELIHALRPNWLNLRGIDALTEGPEILQIDGQQVDLEGQPRLTVYLNLAKLGSVNELKQLPIAGVQAIRYFTGAEATYRWGAGNSHGAIQVLTGEP
jgi:hypothetical protein